MRVRTREIWRKSAPDVATECSGETHHFFAADFFAFFGAGAAAAFFAIAESSGEVVEGNSFPRQRCKGCTHRAAPLQLHAGNLKNTAALANGVRVRTRGNWLRARRGVRRTLPDECQETPITSSRPTSSPSSGPARRRPSSPLRKVAEGTVVRKSWYQAVFEAPDFVDFQTSRHPQQNRSSGIPPGI